MIEVSVQNDAPPLVSVIVPTYNHAFFLPETLDSIRAQTLSRWECIVVDDGSTDETPQLARKYAALDSRIRYLRQENRGLGAARNAGVRSSRGRCIQFLDSDDLIDPSKLEAQTARFELKPQVDVCYSHYRPFESATGVRLEPFWPDMSLPDPLRDFLFRWERGLSIPIHAALFRREVVCAHPFEETLRSREDWLFWIDLALSGAKFEFIDRPLAFYRMHSQNMFRDAVAMAISFSEASTLAVRKLPAGLADAFLKASRRHAADLIALAGSRDQQNVEARGESPELPEPLPAATPPIACTIVARNYMAQALVVAKSFLHHHPASRVFILVVDGTVPPAAEDGIIFIGPGLVAADIRQLAFQYDVTSVCTALKPALLSYLLRANPRSRVIFLDPDILVTRTFDELNTFPSVSITLIPQALTPLPDDGCYPNDLDILNTGMFNLGFLSVQEHPETWRFLQWWSVRLMQHCSIDPARGFFFDQKWVDVAPIFFPSTRVFTDETYDVAYWNFHERVLGLEGGTFTVNGRELAFFHFSGIDLRNKQFKENNTNRFHVVRGTPLDALLNRYRESLEAEGYEKWSAIPYEYQTFSDGRPIHWLFRELYRRLEQETRDRFGDPFRTDAGSFYSWAVESSQDALPPLLRLMWELRPDVAAAFPQPDREDRGRLLQWVRTSGPREFQLDPATLGWG